jgi:uncharacterized membrane protein YeiB
MTPIGPIAPEERINSLDTLRGFALLGILPANVLIFGMYLAAGNDPTVAGGATGLYLASWALFRILIEGKMRCLFSMVFGASMILLTSRAEEHSGPPPPTSTTGGTFGCSCSAWRTHSCSFGATSCTRTLCVR